MKLLVLGAGGIGGYFGGRLAEAGADVTFLVRPKRREQIERDGLRIESPLGNAVIQARTVLAGELRPDYDLALFTCKAYDLDSAMDAIAPAVGPRCAVLPVLNGIAHYERLDARFGRGQVMGGTCHINVTLRKDGVVAHGDPLQRILFGERDRVKSPRSLAFAQLLAGSRLDWVHSEDIEQDLYEKMVFLCALASVTCLFRANVGEIVAAPGGKEIMQRAMDANVAVVTAEGHPPRPGSVEPMRKRFTDPAGTWSASMLRDLEAGGPVEADHIVGWMLGKARKHGIDDAVLAFAYAHLKAYENRRAAGRP